MEGRVRPMRETLRRMTGTGTRQVSAYRARDVEQLTRHHGTLTQGQVNATVERNKQFIRDEYAKGKRFFDIGGDKGQKPSPWYNGEKEVLRDELGLRQKFRGFVSSNGGLVPLWEWVK